MKLPRKLGQTPLVGAMLKFTKDPLRFLEWAQTLNEPVVYDKAMGQYYYIVYDADLIDHVLIKNAKNYKKNHILKFWDDYFGEGLLTADGETWQKDRRMIQPLFTKDKIQAYTRKFDEVGNEFFSSWKVGDKKTIDLEMNELSMNLFMETILGAKLTHEQYVSVSHDFEVCAAYFRFSSDPMGMYVSKLPRHLVPQKLKYKKAIKSLHQLIERIVTAKKKDIETGKTNVDLVTTLLKARYENGNLISEANLRDQVMTFFQAGHETSALTLSYVIHQLSVHPDIQLKLRAELKSIFKDGKYDFESAPLLNGVILESMRLFSPSWMLGRDAVNDDKMGEFDVPAKAMVIVPTWAKHRNPKVYDRHEEFVPERWTPEFEAKLRKGDYLPFGVGSRMCIGATFAMYEMKYAVANLYMKFGTKLLSSSKLEFITSVTARNKYPIEVELTH